MSTEKDLKYWKANAEEDYKQVPISVLRYITELETSVSGSCSPNWKEAYKECFERFIPINKWNEAQEFLTTYGSGLAKEIAKKEK